MSTLAEREALALLIEYREAMRDYYQNDPDVLERVESWKMTYAHGWFYLDRTPMRRKEVERRIGYFLEGKKK